VEWLTEVEPSILHGPDQNYHWERTEKPTNVHVVRDIDEEAMKRNFFDTLNRSSN